MVRKCSYLSFVCLSVYISVSSVNCIPNPFFFLSVCLSVCLFLCVYVPMSLFLVPLPVVTISPGSVNVSYNSTVTLTCEVQSLTIPNVIWMSNTDVILPPLSLVSNNDIHTSVLTLEQVTLEYIGEYNCTAENEGGEMSDMINFTVYGKNMCVSIHLSSIYLSVYLYVSSLIIHSTFSLSLSSSLPVVIISPGSVNVSYNSTVTLTCEVQSLTIPNVIWMSNTDVILPPPSLVSNDDIHTSVLTLEQVTLEYIGEYNCTADNEGGEMTDMIRVDVYGKYMSVSIHLSVHLPVCVSVCYFSSLHS